MTQPFQSRAEYEAALSEAGSQVDHCAQTGTPADPDLIGLLEQIAAYREETPEVAPTAMQALEEHLQAFANRKRDDVFLRRDDPDGIGPSLGMDVGHS